MKFVSLTNKGVTGYLLPDDPYSCWQGVGATDTGGYLQIYDSSEKRLVPLHRFVYERQTKETVPEGRECHHVCSDRRCCNPRHIELVTRAEHSAIHKAARTHCRKGHPYVTGTPGDTGRRCEPCRTTSLRKAHKKASNK